MSRSNLSKLKIDAVRQIARKAKLERRIARLQEELVTSIKVLDRSVKYIAQLEEKLNAPPTPIS